MDQYVSPPDSLPIALSELTPLLPTLESSPATVSATQAPASTFSMTLQAPANTTQLSSSEEPSPAGAHVSGVGTLRARSGGRNRRRRAIGRAARGSGFSRVEVDGLLDLLDEVKPIGRDEWETVTRRHNEKFPGVDRTVESHRRKFAKLYKTNMGTGNPNMPEDVARAIEIATAITQRADLARGDDIEEDANELFEDGGDPIDEREKDDAVSRPPVAAAARPLVLPRQQPGKDDELLSLARVMLLQDQRHREADREQQIQWREDDRRQREEDRRERERDRADDRERSNRLFELLATALVGIAKAAQSSE